MASDTAKPKELPRLVVVLVVVATGAATVWAATKAGPLGPYTSWDRAQQAVYQVWNRGGQSPSPQMAQGTAYQAPTGQLSAPPPAAQGEAATAPADSLLTLPDNNAARTVGLPGVPTILWGTPRPHRDRGPCTNCHSVAMNGGQRVPTIFSFSSMPHEFRGVCNNCHQVSVAGFGGNLVAGTRPLAANGAEAQLPGMPNEAEWRGIEARMVDQGVVVTKADGTAGRSGVQPGDIVDSINGVPIRTMMDFVQVTQNGDLLQGTLIARRNGQRLAFELQQNQQAAPPPGAGAMSMPQQSAPQQQMSVPQEQMLAPQQQMLAPQQQMLAPQQQMSVPQQPMPLPQQQMFAPAQPMPLPQQQMFGPAQPMPSPQQQMFAPQQMPSPPFAPGR